MDEYLPSISIQKGLNFNNHINNHQRFSSVDNTKKNFYKNYNNYKYNNFKLKQELNNNNYANNFLKIANTNKDEINSTKNNTAITYYNKSYLNKKNFSNRNQNNIFPETYYNYYQKYKAKKAIDNFNSKSYNNIKIIQGNINNINPINNNIHAGAIKNLNLLLPDFSKQKNNSTSAQISTNKQKIQRNGYAHSYSLSNKENKTNAINSINNNSIYNINNIKNNNDLLRFSNLDNQRILPKTNDNLTTIGFLQNNRNNLNIFQNKTYVKKRGISSDNQYIKPYKTNSLFNKSINSSNKKTCPLCHKELENFRYKFHINYHPSKIFDWLYLGSYRNACDKKEIKDIGINYVLNCAAECLESFPIGVKYCHLKLNDTPYFKITPHLEKATSFINQAQENNGIILVHCQLGISRSTSCVIAYMIKYMGYTAMSALDFIKKKRSQVMPNFGFLQQLMVYEKNHMGTGTVKKIEKENGDNNENK